jgi:nucleotidyltransferase substrate binding protein (TIGR01987 family)
MEADGWQPDIVSPKVVLKEAFQAKYIGQIEVWLKMLEDRNLLSHTYNFETIEEVITSVQSTYIDVLQQMYFLLNKLNDA